MPDSDDHDANDEISSDVDSENMIEYLDGFWKQCQEALKLGSDISIEGPVTGVVACGMGGSALPGEIVKGYIDVDIPVDVIRDYSVPKWVNHGTLVFVVSYSGNTEEALACLKSARSKGAKVVCISSGGKLRELCESSRSPIVLVPKGLQPRASTGYQTLPILNILSNSGVIPDQTSEMDDVVKALKKDMKESAKDIVGRIKDKIPLIYSSDRMIAVARLWKAAVNENSKHPAFFNVFPEMNHNDMIGFKQAKNSRYYFIFIEDAEDHMRIKKRMKITKEILQNIGLPVLIIKLTGPNRLARMFSSILMGMYAGYYLALEYGIDPSPVDLVEDLKKQMGPYIS
ncbi:bifunctional phosphoglucose/phosphomannose isomerase [Candidatus Woesearchaeota archaeon]|nr:bifunctional phosphoglucose/phosphomannose isomerase [Candidatus Woesearchaeota archaeon]